MKKRDKADKAEKAENTEMAEIASLGHILASEIKPESMEWLWEPYLPAGEVAMLIGDGGLGKSLLMMDIASRITKGLPMPSNGLSSTSPTLSSSDPDTGVKDAKRNSADGAVVGDVLYCTKENKASKVVVPRLIASGADLSRVHLLTKNPNLTLRGSAIPNMIRETKAKLCVIDPILSFVDSSSDIYDASRLRRIIETDYEDVLDETGCALVLIYHMTKDGRDPVKGAIGSVDNANFARSAFTVLRFPEVPSIKILLHSKANCGPYGRTLAYRIVDQKIEWYDEEDISEDSALIKFIQKYSLCDDDLTIDATEYSDGRTDAAQTLTALLANGPVEIETLKSAFLENYSERTFFHVRSLLNVKKIKIDGKTMLKLP
ncbi:MAG: AAA family ATPase [Lachnospiraceae bacterium]|nr:AAA family ATPase [Lachnospiraceae bacterium]